MNQWGGRGIHDIMMRKRERKRMDNNDTQKTPQNSRNTKANKTVCAMVIENG
mgnify:FL=1